MLLWGQLSAGEDVTAVFSVDRVGDPIAGQPQTYSYEIFMPTGAGQHHYELAAAGQFVATHPQTSLRLMQQVLNTALPPS